MSFFLTDPAPTEIYTLSLHDALPISEREGSRRSTRGFPLVRVLSGRIDAHCASRRRRGGNPHATPGTIATIRRVRLSRRRSEEHTSELQSPVHLVCRLLLEKKK